MSDITYEQASRCPRCDQPGEETVTRPGSRKSTIYILTCRNSACRWYNTRWVVQRLEDGTIPVRASGAEEPRRPKTFPKLPGTASRYEIEDDDTTGRR
jgi:hypothetical protein